MTIGAILLAVAAQQGGVAVTNVPAQPAIVAHSPPVRAPVGAVAPGIGAPPAPPPRVPIATSPRARTPLQMLISAEDYPASALAQRQQGRVEFILDIGADGRVTGCTVTRSSRSAALDNSTCRLMRSRARFTPAQDSQGMPAASRVESGIDWKLPAGGAERG